MVLASCGGSKPITTTPKLIQEGQAASNLSFVDLTTGDTASLSDYQGATVLLEFWASWCANCQQTMPKLQELAAKHPEWQGKVEIIAVSIDDHQSAAEAHVRRKQWEQTRNAWADPMKGGNEELLPYVIRGIPMACVIDAQGIVQGIGHPNRLDAESIINGLLMEGDHTQAIVRPVD